MEILITKTRNKVFLNLISTDTGTGVVTTIGEITNADPNAPASMKTLKNVMVRALDGRPENDGKGISIGEVHEGTMYVAIGNQENQSPADKDNDLYVVNLATKTFTKINTSYPYPLKNIIKNRIGPDMVYSSGFLYSVNGRNDKNPPVLNILNATTGVGTIKEISGLPNAEASYGALWLAKDPDSGEIKFYTYSNDTGVIYEITNVDTAPTAIFRSKGVPLGNNDGAACPNAAPPVFGIDAVNDADATPLNTPVDVKWRDNDSSTSGSDFSLDKFDSISANGGNITVNVDGTFKYTPATNFYGTDTFKYTICIDDKKPEICDSATVTITIKASIDASDDDMGTTNGQESISFPLGKVFDNDTITDGLKISLCGDPSFTQAANGTVTLVNDEFVYIANKGFEGTDSYTYTICDEKGGSKDTATIKVAVVLPVLSVIKTDNNVSVGPGEDIKYFIQSTNSGAGDAKAVVLTETVPEHTKYVGDDEGWECEDDGVAGDTCTFEIGTIKSGDISTVSFTVKLDADVPDDITSVDNIVVLGDNTGISVQDDENTPIVRVKGIVVENGTTTTQPLIPVVVLGTNATRGALPYTGSNSSELFFIGAVLLVSGLILFNSRKRLNRKLNK